MKTAEDNKSQNFPIYRLKWKDLPAFLRLRHQIEHDATHLVPEKGERKETLLYALARLIVNRRRTHTFIAVNDKKPVGYISIIFAKFKKLRGNAYLVLSVVASHHGRGIGTRLMQTAEEFARKRGIRRLELEVFAKNERAIKLFERLGYEKEGRRRKAVEGTDGFDDIIFMAKFL